MLDVSLDRQDSSKAVAYFDGKDARVFVFLREKLGSDERVQNAIILLGLIAKLGTSTRKSDRLRLQKARKAFVEFVGIPYEKLEELLVEEGEQFSGI